MSKPVLYRTGCIGTGGRARWLQWEFCFHQVGPFLSSLALVRYGKTLQAWCLLFSLLCDPKSSSSSWFQTAFCLIVSNCCLSFMAWLSFSLPSGCSSAPPIIFQGSLSLCPSLGQFTALIFLNLWALWVWESLFIFSPFSADNKIAISDSCCFYWGAWSWNLEDYQQKN